MANKTETLPFMIQPRAFAALGADLVTKDVVAVVQLAKNSYDAWATEVEISFGHDNGTPNIEISDNGCGMSRDLLEDV